MFRTCPDCGGQVVWINQGTKSAWVLMILGICLTPFVIGIPIFAVGLYLLIFKRRAVTKCTGCQKIGV